MIRAVSIAGFAAMLALSGCGPLGATLGMAAAGGAGGSLLGSLFGGTAAATYPSLSVEIADVEAAATLIHKHEMTIDAIQQAPAVVMLPTPVVVTPGAPATSPVTVTPPPPIPAPKPVPTVP